MVGEINGDFKEFGELSTAAKGGLMEKERWLTAIQLAEDGKMEELKNSELKMFVTHYSTWQRIRKDSGQRPSEMDDVTGLWILGQSGCGKSRSARQAAANFGVTYYVKNCNKWWDNYKDEPVVIMNDVDKTHSVLGHHLKIWSDRYALW